MTIHGLSADALMVPPGYSGPGLGRRGGLAASIGVPKGIRTPVTAVKGRCPRPLDDGDLETLTAAGGRSGGGKRDRTADLLHAMQALSQLSYTPTQGCELYHAGNCSRSRAST